MSIARTRGYRFGLVLAAAMLAGIVIRSGLGHGLSSADPALAARIDGGNGMALGAASDRALKTAQTEAEVAQVRELSRRAILASPMEAQALRNLGFLTAIAESEDAAERQLNLAGKLSKRDYFTHAWLLDRRFRQGRVTDAVVEADIVLRQRESAWPVIIPELVKISGDPRILEPMTAALVKRPVWRSSYLNLLGQQARNLEAAYAQFRLLRQSSAPPEPGELRSYFARFDGSDPDRLWSEWLALTPRARQQGTVRDSGFDGLDAPPPFNWTLYPRDSIYAEIGPSPSGPGNALYVSYEGDRDAGFAQQTLKLGPGRYRLSARAFAEEPVKPDQILIEIACGPISRAVPVKRVFIEPEPGIWAPVSADFAIDAGCRLQQLRINGALGDFRTRASIWLDDIAISRLGDAPRPVGPNRSGTAETPPNMNPAATIGKRVQAVSSGSGSLSARPKAASKAP